MFHGFMAQSLYFVIFFFLSFFSFSNCLVVFLLFSVSSLVLLKMLFKW